MTEMLPNLDPTDVVTVAPKPAGDDFVDSADTDKTATLYYVDTGVEDVTMGVPAEDGTARPDDGIDQTKIFLERVSITA